MSHRYLRGRRLVVELLYCSPLLLAFILLNAEFDVAEKVLDFLAAYEGYELDDLVVSILFFLPLYLVFFAFRRKREIEMLVKETGTDALTGILNRRRIMEHLSNEVHRAHRYKRSLSLIMFDIDHFKVINDNFGHPVGDEVLSRIARKVDAYVRNYDYLGRIGGEEFMLIAAESDGRTAIDLAERLRFLIEQENFGIDHVVTASFGVSELRRGEGYSELFQRTDERLYWSKNSGRNRVSGPDSGKT